MKEFFKSIYNFKMQIKPVEFLCYLMVIGPICYLLGIGSAIDTLVTFFVTFASLIAAVFTGKLIGIETDMLKQVKDKDE